MSVDSESVSLVGNQRNQPDLRGNKAPVGVEIDVAGCEVVGEIPTGLHGSFIRNGPNPMFEPVSSYHMFDGDGMLHDVSFGDGQASYKNRWIQSRALGAEISHGSAIYSGLGELSDMPDRSLTGSAGPVKNPANTHIIKHAERLLALWEGGLPTEIADDLSTVGEFNFDGKLQNAMTAHPRLDPRTGEMIFFGYSLFEPYMRYYVADSSGALVHSVDIDLPAPVMMHDMVITEDYSVFLDSPLVFDLANMGKGPLVRWMPENGTRIGVMPRMGTADDLKWFEIEPGHVQHFWNGWQDGNRIELSGCRFDAPDFGIDPTVALDESGSDFVPGRPAQFWVDLDASTAGWEQLDDMGGDFCRFNDDYTGVKSDFAYMSAFDGPPGSAGEFDTIVKYDHSTGERTKWNSGGHVGESVYAADPVGSAEDDGWLVNAVFYEGAQPSQADGGHTEVCVLDARDVAAGPIARVRLPQRIPFGFHANWFPT